MHVTCSHVDSTWPAVHLSTMKTGSNHGCMWTKLPSLRHAAYTIPFSVFSSGSWACLSKLIFQLTDKSYHPNLFQPDCNLRGSWFLCQEAAGRPPLSTCGIHYDFSHILKSNVLEHQLFSTRSFLNIRYS